MNDNSVLKLSYPLILYKQSNNPITVFFSFFYHKR